MKKMLFCVLLTSQLVNAQQIVFPSLKNSQDKTTSKQEKNLVSDFDVEKLTTRNTYGDSVSIELEAEVTHFPPSIILTFPEDKNALSFMIYKKMKGSYNWVLVSNGIPGSSTSFTDFDVVQNQVYDYKVLQNSVNPASIPVKYGYISAGIAIKANGNKGISLVVLDTAYRSSSEFQEQFTIYLRDLENDGWMPKVIFVDRSDSPSFVKDLIVNKYNESPTNTVMLTLIGNVPVPYSGDINPDGHGDHRGAWPTDMYYADIDGYWTDSYISDETSSNPKNHNLPNDGKFDQSSIPGMVELQVGRIDFSDLPSCSSSEEKLLINYFKKLHAYKVGQVRVKEKALVDNEFMSFKERFGQNGYRNFSSLVGRNNIVDGDYLTDLSYKTNKENSYLWSYGCGGGSYTSANGIANSYSISRDSLSSVFTMLFGSYFGDWNYTDGLLKSSLTQGNALTTVWAARPNWHFYHMALGENIGYSAKITQNNNGQYISNTEYPAYFTSIVSMNLLGDPSLRNVYCLPPSDLIILEEEDGVQMNWFKSPDADGYNVYRRFKNSTDFVKLNEELITNTSFFDFTLTESGDVVYYVKAVQNKLTPSGTFENESIAIQETIKSTASVNEIPGDLTIVYPNPFQTNITIKSKKRFDYELLDVKSTVVLTGISIDNSTKIDGSMLEIGIYFLKITDDLKNVSIVKVCKD